ncbi:hypothetical protein CsSME_00007476 [Camellia sinensis var. sinensis]|uniref:Uncharacterized protein n=1 Tax=Camellia sinensis TaxID=4442 RepID=A0A7J7HWY0_CAMSI|nr:hypothetical protein HYC85_004354 [Camellia sinensis]
MEKQGGRDMSYNSAEMGGQDHRSMSHPADDMSGQTQMRHDQVLNQGSKNPAQGAQGVQGTNFIQQTGENVMSMAHGAATIAQGAVQGAANIAQGAAMGAANVAQGAASAMKNTLGVNPDNTSNTNNPSKPNTRI